MQMLDYMAGEHEELIREIEEKKDLNDELVDKILKAADAFKERFQ